MLCPACRTDNFEGEDSCSNCGADLRTRDIPQSLAEHQDAVRRGGRGPVPPPRRAAPVTAPVETVVRDGAPPRIVVLADDLIWGSRLVAQLRAAGAEPVPARDRASFAAALAGAAGVIVDTTALAYDGVEALGLAQAAGVPAMAVAQHDDAPLRRAARNAGARRVYAYRALFEHGPRELAAWLAVLGTDEERG